MIHIVGAGCGAPDLITLRGKKYIEEADVIIYAGSLVNPELLRYAKQDCEIYDSAKMTLEEILSVVDRAEADRKNLPRRNRIAQHLLRQRVRIKIGVHQFLGRRSCMLAYAVIICIKLHTAGRKSAL